MRFGYASPGPTDGGAVTSSRLHAFGPYSPPTDGNLQTISVYLGTVAGNIQLALYADNGGTPAGGAKIAETASTAAVNGWNTLNTTTNPSISHSSSYWICCNCSGTPHFFYIAGGANKGLKFVAQAYGTMPATYPASPTDASTIGQWSIYANTAETDMAVNNANLYFSGQGFAPNWYVNGTVSATTIYVGAYLKTTFSGTACQLLIDNSKAPARFPKIAYSVDGGAYTSYTTLAGDSQITLASGLANTTHTLEIVLQGIQTFGNVLWSTADSGFAGLVVNGLILDSGASLGAPTLKPNKLVAIGDSITAGDWALGPAGTQANDVPYGDGTNPWPRRVATNLNAECAILGVGGQQYHGANASNDVPGLDTSHNLILSGVTRIFGTPNYVLINMGQNDSTLTAAQVQATLGSVRTDYGTSPYLFSIPPFPGANHAAITTGYASYQSATPDANAFQIDLGNPTVAPGFASTFNTNGPGTAWTTDDWHPNSTGAMNQAAVITAAMNNDIPVPFTGNGWAFTLLGVGASSSGGTSQTVLIDDTFFDSNGQDLKNHTANPGPGGPITSVSGALTINSNQLGITTTPAVYTYASVGQANTTCTLVVNFGAGLTDDAGVICRYQDSSNYWYAYLDAALDVLYLKEQLAGSWIVRASVGVALAINTQYTLTVSCSGSSITASTIILSSLNAASYSLATDFQGKTVFGLGGDVFETSGSRTVNSISFEVTNP